MSTLDLVRQWALSLEGATEEPHFEKASFRIKKKIFVTLDQKKNQIVVKFSEMDQSLFGAFDNTIIYPVPNKWGKQGWTIIELNKVPKETLQDAIKAAYCEVAPPHLAAKYGLKKE